MTIKFKKDADGRITVWCGNETLIIEPEDKASAGPGPIVRKPITPGRGVAWVRLRHGSVSIERTDDGDRAIGRLDDHERLYLDASVVWPDELDVGSLSKAVEEELGFFPQIIVSPGGGDE